MEDKVLGNEVIAIEMGALICNLTDYVSINFQNAEYVSETKQKMCFLNERKSLTLLRHVVHRKEYHPVNHGTAKVFLIPLDIMQINAIKECQGKHSGFSFPLLGEQINWTDAGCKTITNGSKITCRCSHMTFFAILLVRFTHFNIHGVLHLFPLICNDARVFDYGSFQTPLNETISSYDLNTLTTITQVGCGVSMFFLCVVFFMHFFLR